MDERYEEMLDALTEYFKAGIKKQKHRAVGVEIEHFILDKDTCKAVSFSGEQGVSRVLAELMALYPGAEASPGKELLGFSVPEFNITLEPAAQLEISIIQTESIKQIGEIYKDFRQKLDFVLERFHAFAGTYGCQPVSRIGDLSLIPKERYELMDRYFREAGTDGAEMMRGTCSTQASVDYFSEEDFRRKIQAAYYYTPFLKLLSDNNMGYEGRKDIGFLKRTDIWNRTDSTRCGILPGIFSKDYGFRDYACFLSEMPLIFSVKDDVNHYTGMEKTRQVYAGKVPDQDDIFHIISMAFPDVRLKNYLEIRAADSMPAEYVLAYCAFIKGLLYSEEVLDFVQEEIKQRHITETDVKATEQKLREFGWDSDIYGIPAREFALGTLDRAASQLSGEEKDILETFCNVPGNGIKK